MPPLHWVDEEGRYDGRPLADWLDEVVDDVARSADPLEIVVFGSVAGGASGPDSDLDLLVVVPEVPPGERYVLMGRIRAAIGAPVPVDLFVTDPAEYEPRRDVPGSRRRFGQATEDLDAARVLRNNGPPRVVCLLAHLAAEKAIKAALIATGTSWTRTWLPGSATPTWRR